MESNQNSEKLTSRIFAIAGDIFIATLRVVIKTLLWIAKHIWKRYFGIETPVYKLWWKSHAANMQKKLDKCHQINY